MSPVACDLPARLSHSDRLQRLDQLLCDSAWLWRPQPFKTSRPAWGATLSVLADELLALSDQQVTLFSNDPDLLGRWLTPHLPQLAELQALTHLAETHPQPFDPGPHFANGIRGRKWQQIRAFAGAIEQRPGSLLEWCGGKGHLGRLLARRDGVRVTTLDHDPQLCRDGERLARREAVGQQFMVADLLQLGVEKWITAERAVALHACGELHRNLVRAGAARRLETIAIAPCCYAKGSGEHYRPFTPNLQLTLTAEDLRLAVTDTATAAGREVRQRDREMAWKLVYDRLRREATGEEGYRPFRPIDRQWLRLDIAGFCRQLALREGVTLAGSYDWPALERQGWQRQREVMRLSLLRGAFRRAIEVWLLLDMACYLEGKGYRVTLEQFCGRALTPRNILLQAQRL